MNILWHDDVYPFIEISQVVKPPYCVSDNFIEAVKNVIDKLYPSNLRKPDGTKVLIIEKDTAMMGDLFFAHVDQVSRQLFDLSSIQEKIKFSSLSSHLSTKYLGYTRFLKFFSIFNRNRIVQDGDGNYNSIYADASFIILSKFIFFSASAFISHRRFHNKKERFTMAIEYLISNKLIYQPSDKVRFIKGAHTSYAMLSPNQIKNNDISIKALAKLNLTIGDYEKIWQQCTLPSSELSSKIEKSAINHIKSHLNDYISIIHRLGSATDPVAQEILKPGLLNGEIGISFDPKSFSLASEYIVPFNNDNDIMEQLKTMCIRASNENVGALDNTELPMFDNHGMIVKISDRVENFVQYVDDCNQLQAQQSSSVTSANISSNEYYPTNKLQHQVVPNEKSKIRHSLSILISSTVISIVL
jgi:hypothetical protein